jgi:hypothetical protein
MPDGASHSATVEGAGATQPGEPGGIKQQLLRWREWLTPGKVDLNQDPPDHGVFNAWVAFAAAIVVGSVLSLQDWQAVRDKPEFGRYLFVDAIAAFVLTPLFVSVQLGLREIVTRLLRRLIRHEVIRPAANGERPSQFGPEMDGRLDQRWVVMSTRLATAVYLTYQLLDALNEMTSLLTTLLIATALVVQVGLFYLGVLTIFQIWEACRAVGTFLGRFKVDIRPLHPDYCGGLAPVGHMLEMVLTAAAILGSAGLCIFLAVHDTPSGLTRRPEPYILAGFYFFLLPAVFLNLLWGPHQLMRKRREELLMLAMQEFRDAISATPPATEDVIPSAADKARRLKVRADSLSAISSEFKAVDDACPVWPLRVRRLQGVIATAVLPVVIPVVTAIISSFLARAP